MNDGTAASSIISMLSALSYFHKLNNTFDPTHAFAIRQLVIAVRRSLPSGDSRQPITENMLIRMFDRLPKIGLEFYETLLFQAAFLCAFYFGLRISEYTDSQHNIQMHQLAISATEVHLTFFSFKHSGFRPETHSITSSDAPICVVKSLLTFLSYRGNAAGPLFLLRGKPISRQFFCSILRRVVGELGWGNNIKSHSFRIGAASFWAEKGFSELQIKLMGRWRSDAISQYFRGEIKHSLF